MSESLISRVLRSARPKQWLKNLVLFAPLVFSAQFFVMESVARASLAFLVVCLVTSAIYIANDIRDREEDRAHPTKKRRPIASGSLSVWFATLVALVLLITGLALAWTQGLSTVLALLGLIVVNAVYVFGGKRIAILDVMLIGTSFVARVVVGAVAIGVPASVWLLLTLFFLATYLGFTKRTSELKLSQSATRHALKDYTPAFLDHARSATLAVTLALYTLYTFDSPYSPLMAVTVPFVFFGLLRYQAIVDRDDGKNDGPSDHVYLDTQLQVAIGAWAATVVAIIFFTT